MPVQMISCAGRDTALVAGLTKAGMLFVPSRDGRSHCPQEHTRIEDIVLGSKILLDAIVELATYIRQLNGFLAVLRRWK